MHKFDLIVIGAGAAGLMACASAIRVGKNVLLLEKNAKLGVKILMSGGTRCNITHACQARDIVEAFGDQGKFLHSALAALPPHDVVSLIESTGVKTKTETGGKIFPVSDRAVDVRDGLVELATDVQQPGHCNIVNQTACREIRKSDAGFTICSDDQKFHGSSVLITTGGMSYPGCGTTGDGYGWAGSMGHNIVNPVPALTPITNHSCWTHALKGISFEQVKLRVLRTANNQCIDSTTGAFLFTHFGYSGPAALDISRAVSQSESHQDLVLECDFEPEFNPEQLRKQIVDRLKSKPRQNVSTVFSSLYKKRFSEALLESLQIDGNRKAAELSKTDLNKWTDNLKHSVFPISGVYGFKKAEVTAGGVALAQVDSRTMQSKICEGLFFAGEVLDLDGPIGGYNFQAAFSTGWLAGIHA